ncbi:hypothetical protein MUU72_10470 [Streptomyces sp. RS10V-4]|uniref:hypothetical protein n=1 Tax=Streptomyces rhizoryzae TaxID=2932493 RepID=UPI00200666AF|nr:hypothetical protein [Streptomyces rhizoryzae]MCK7623511.1 hypothetical protein [Streptomyces rhizoryzae]
MSAPEPMWEVSADAEAPRPAAAQDATGPHRADAAFEPTLAAYLAHLRAASRPAAHRRARRRPAQAP